MSTTYFLDPEDKPLTELHDFSPYGKVIEMNDVRPDRYYQDDQRESQPYYFSLTDEFVQWCEEHDIQCTLEERRYVLEKGKDPQMHKRFVWAPQLKFTQAKDKMLYRLTWF